MAASSFFFSKHHKSSELLHIIWLGSSLRQAHQQRIKKWLSLNPGYTVYLWVEKEFKKESKAQFDNKNLKVKTVNKLKLPTDMKKFIQAVTLPCKRPPNYAAASDIYRFWLLNHYGGWYADTDITPVSLDSIKLNQSFDFHFCAEQKGENITLLTPDVIFSTKHSRFSKQALKCIEAFMPLFNREEVIRQIRSPVASVRARATCTTTGFILRATLGKLFVDDKPLLEVLNSQDSTTSYPGIFATLHDFFSSEYETSWLFDEKLSPLQGIIIDSHYEKWMQGDSDLGDDFFEEQLDVRYKIYQQIVATRLSLPKSVTTDKTKTDEIAHKASSLCYT